jgi:hypothetical protein
MTLREPWVTCGGQGQLIFMIFHAKGQTYMLLKLRDFWWWSDTLFKIVIMDFVCLSIYGSTVLLLDLGRLFSFLILYTVGRTPWTGDQPAARPLPTHRKTQAHNKRTQTSMPWVGLEPMIPAFEQAKTVHVLDRAATSIGGLRLWVY